MTDSRARLIAEHDRLVSEYNETEERELLEVIALIEMQLLAKEPK